MSSAQSLHGEHRNLVGKKVRRLRQNGITPGVLYGPSVEEPLNVQFNTFDLEKYVRGIEESSLVNVYIDDAEYTVLFKDIAYHPVKPEIIAVDLYAPNLNQLITSPVHLDFVGTSEAVEVYSGLLVKNKHEVEVEAMPRDLPEHIQVDLSKLQTFDDVLRVEDITVPEGVKLLHSSQEVIALVEHPHQQEEPEEESGEPSEEPETTEE
jgi:large subunit ribosomal protein L25